MGSQPFTLPIPDSGEHVLVRVNPWVTPSLHQIVLSFTYLVCRQTMAHPSMFAIAHFCLCFSLKTSWRASLVTFESQGVTDLDPSDDWGCILIVRIFGCVARQRASFNILGPNWAKGTHFLVFPVQPKSTCLVIRIM